MPYIRELAARIVFNRIAEKLTIELMIAGGIRGNLNYFIFKLFKEYIENFTRRNNYAGMADFLSELHECEEEIRRRYLVPYEDKKIEENGDVE